MRHWRMYQYGRNSGLLRRLKWVRALVQKINKEKGTH